MTVSHFKPHPWRTTAAIAPLAIALIVLVQGCGKSKPEVVLTPITGVVLIDGKPHELVAVRCHPTDGSTDTLRNIGQSFTDKQGKFAISAKNKGDGLPAGEYVLTFEWGEMNLLSMQYGGPDKFGGKYSDPKKSQVKFTVAENQPVDLGTIELTSK